MQTYKKTSFALLIICAVTVGTIVGTFSVPAQNNSDINKQPKFDKAEFERQFPVTEINKPEPADPDERTKRRAKGKKYDDVGITVTENKDYIVLNTEWDVGLPALPIAKSDLILIGEVAHAEAFLSNDKTGVYTEFTIQVHEVLKNSANIELNKGSSLIANRQGGRVRFTSGHITLQFVRGQGMPRVGRRYALFLTHDGQTQNTYILTGYELRGGRIFPIDNPAGGQHPIATVYKEADETSFLNDLRAAVANAQ